MNYKNKNNFEKFKNFIEQKRNSDKLFFMAIIIFKDFMWIFLEFLKNNDYKKSIATFMREKYSDNTGLKDVFENIYKKNIWSMRGGYGSGPGSLPEKTVEYRNFLQDFIKKNKIKTILDAGCGDWQFSKLIDWSGLSYVGIDIVPFLIEENNKKYSCKNIKFYKKNIITDDLPKADLIIAKDVLQHLSNENIFKFLPKLKNYKFTLLINDSGSENTDCKNGNFRKMDLRKPPYNLDGKEVFFFENKQVLLIENRKNFLCY